MARKRNDVRLPSPFLRRISVRQDVFEEQSGYPFDLPWLGPDFELVFENPVTIIVGENGVGKSTLVEAIAGLSGYDEAGGGKGYRPVDHSGALEKNGGSLSNALRGSWLPKVTNGWFFRAESFFSVARYLDRAAIEAGAAPPDFLSWSHGEGFIRFFEERCARQGIYFMDEPESALSPKRQIELLKILHRINVQQKSQVIVATHSPLIMALPGATLLEVSRHGIAETRYDQTQHFRLYQDFTSDPEGFLSDALSEEE